MLSVIYTVFLAVADSIPVSEGAAAGGLVAIAVMLSKMVDILADRKGWRTDADNPQKPTPSLQIPPCLTDSDRRAMHDTRRSVEALLAQSNAASAALQRLLDTPHTLDRIERRIIAQGRRSSLEDDV